MSDRTIAHEERLRILCEKSPGSTSGPVEQAENSPHDPEPVPRETSRRSEC